LRVYHFLDKKFGLLALQQRRLKVSLPNNLNDPFDHRGIKTDNKQTRLAIKHALAEMSKVQGLLCFSKSYRSPVMWAHYADRHRGVCLGFDVSENDLTQVNYVKELLAGQFVADMNVNQDEVILAEELVKTKHSGWSYEKEYRAFVGLESTLAFAGMNFVEFSDQMKLRQIMVGYASEISRSDIQRVIGSSATGLDCFQVRPAFHKFRMVRNRDADLWQ